MYPSPVSVARSEDEGAVDAEPRKRTARACDSCYRRKIKCDAEIPCNWCSHHNIPCTFERSTRRKRKAIKGDGSANGNGQQTASHLAERISRIERLLEKNVMRVSERVPREYASSPAALNMIGNATPPAPDPAQPAASTFGALHFAGRKLGTVSCIANIPFLVPEAREWIESRTGQTTTFDKLNHSHPPWERQRLSSNALTMKLSIQNTLELPEQGVVQNYFELFSSSILRMVFPIIEPVLFAQTIKDAYQQQPQSNSQHGHASTRAYIFAFVAFASILNLDRFHNLPGPAQLPPAVDSEALVAKAQCLLPQILQEPTTPDGMGAVVVLALFEFVTGNMRSATYFCSLTTRFIFMLGAHIAAPTSMSNDLDSKTQHHLRNLFWLCYIFDKDVALRTGQPQMLSEENCDLTLPPGYLSTLHSNIIFHEQYQQLLEGPIFPIDLRLSIIKSRTHSALYSFKALQKSDAELLKEIRELDDELERWRMSVPPLWRPTMSYSHETPLDPNANMHSVVLRLNYHLCMTVIHQASSRCKAWVNGQSGMMDGVSSSLALSVEASRSTLMYLRAAEHVLVSGAFWAIIFYPMSALICIFCNILQNPLDPQSSQDLDLLKVINGVMERVFLRQFSSINEIVHIKVIADFVMELHWLAKCAIDKALKERVQGGGGV